MLDIAFVLIEICVLTFPIWQFIDSLEFFNNLFGYLNRQFSMAKYIYLYVL